MNMTRTEDISTETLHWLIDNIDEMFQAMEDSENET
jgi:hypothetical protein